MTDDVKLDYWMIEVLEEAMSMWWKSKKFNELYTVQILNKMRSTPNAFRLYDIGKLELIREKLSQIRVAYDAEIMQGLSCDMIIKDDIVETKIPEYACPKCSEPIEPTEHNKSYFMCTPCMKGWSIEELELIVFAKAYLCIDLKWHQVQTILSTMVKL